MGRKAKSSREGGTSDGKELKMFLKNRMWRDYWHAILAVGVILFAFFFGTILQFSYSTDVMQRLDVSDKVVMQQVFKSGESWTLLCSSPDDVIPQVFQDAAPKLAASMNVGVLDCSQKLPSGKSIYKRFKLRKLSPTVFTVANSGKPKQIYLDDLSSSKALINKAHQQTKQRKRKQK